MKWIRKDKYYEESDCKIYTVSASKVMGNWRFTCWRVEDKKNLGVFDEAKLARAQGMKDGSRLL